MRCMGFSIFDFRFSIGGSRPIASNAHFCDHEGIKLESHDADFHSHCS